MSNALEIPAFLRRSNTKETAMTKPKTQEEDRDGTLTAEKEARPTKAQFLEAAELIEKIDAKIEEVEKSVEVQIAELNSDRNVASEVVRKYLGRKR